jgi:hypothetical protein
VAREFWSLVCYSIPGTDMWAQRVLGEGKAGIPKVASGKRAVIVVQIGPHVPLLLLKSKAD